MGYIETDLAPISGRKSSNNIGVPQVPRPPRRRDQGYHEPQTHRAAGAPVDSSCKRNGFSLTPDP